MAYVSRSSSGDFDFAKIDVWEERNLAVWILSEPKNGWDPSGWIRIDVSTPIPYYFIIWASWGSARVYFNINSQYLGKQARTDPQIAKIKKQSVFGVLTSIRIHPDGSQPLPGPDKIQTPRFRPSQTPSFVNLARFP